MRARTASSPAAPRILLFVGLPAGLALAAGAASFEAPGTFPASRSLKPAELAGTEWKVAPEATSDGMFNLYTVESRFGSFDARGRARLGFRVKEVEAMAELERVSKTEVFTDAVVATAVAPVKVVASFAGNPKETVKGISSGVKRFWSKTKFQAKEVSHDAKKSVSGGSKGEDGEESPSKTDVAKKATQDYAKQYLGLSKAERRWCAELGIDPYTDNVALKKAVKEVSRVEAVATLGMRYSGMPSIPGAREIGKVMDLVWKSDPWELRERNRKILLAAGFTENEARDFEDNGAMSPTSQTAILQSFTDLEGVPGRKQIVKLATEVGDRPAARVLVTSTALLVRYHRDVAPFAEILSGPRLPVARTKSGRLVAVVVADTLYWTPEISEAVRAFADSFKADAARERELRVAGLATDRFKSELKGLGWQVLDGWQLSSSEDDQPAPKPAA